MMHTLSGVFTLGIVVSRTTVAAPDLWLTIESWLRLELGYLECRHQVSES
jgi:hypothetical protein